MAKMKSCGTKGYAEGGDVEDDVSEKRAAPRRTPPARPQPPRLPAGRREEDFVPSYQGNTKDLLNREGPILKYGDRPARAKSGGLIRGGGVESKGKTKGRFV